jgi:hypothetical protein
MVCADADAARPSNKHIARLTNRIIDGHSSR